MPIRDPVPPSRRLAAVVLNPKPMALWAGLIAAFMILGIATLYVGLIIAFPLIGHATWHAYRDLVDASALPERTAPRTERAR